MFLTKGGSEPGEHGEGWFALELADVAQELQRVVNKGAGRDAARDYLTRYLSMLRRHHLPDDRLDDFAAKLWSQHREALEFLMERNPQGGAGVFGRLYDARNELAEILTEAARVPVVLDDCTRGTIRFAVPAWDERPEMLTAIGWTSSKRLLLLELAPDGDRNAIRIRFVIGQGNSDARQRLHSFLDAVGLKSSRKTITKSWTRLATETLATKLNETDEDPEAVYNQLRAKIAAYGKATIPKADEAFRRNASPAG